MTNLTQLDSFEDLIGAIGWTFIVYGLASAVFRSFIGQEIFSRVKSKDSIRADMANKLRWEITNRRIYRPNVRTDDEMQALKSLNDGEIDNRRRKLEDMRNGTLLPRAALFFASCSFCQNTWAAVFIYLVSAPFHLGNMVASSLGYAVMCSFVARLTMSSPSIREDNTKQARGGCSK